jgi:IS5 family transposase
MKVDGRLDRNFLAGARGDTINALLCGAGYNLRLILNHLRRLLRALLLALAGDLQPLRPDQCKLDSSGATSVVSH